MRQKVKCAQKHYIAHERKLEEDGVYSSKFDLEIEQIYNSRACGLTGDINQAFTDLYDLITDDPHFKRYEEVQLVPYGSAINGLLDSDKD